MKLLLAICALALAHSASATVFYSVSVQSGPDFKWWGSFGLYSPGFITGPVTINEADFGFNRQCIVIFPNGHDCDSVTFDAQGNGPDVVVMHTTFGDFPFSFTDGAFLTPGFHLTAGNTALLHVQDLNPVPEPAGVWLMGAGLIGVAVAARRRRTSRRSLPQPPAGQHVRMDYPLHRYRWRVAEPPVGPTAGWVRVAAA